MTINTLQFVEKNKVLQQIHTNFHKASVFINAKFIRLDGKDYEVTTNKIDFDNKTLEIWLKDIS